MQKKDVRELRVWWCKKKKWENKANHHILKRKGEKNAQSSQHEQQTCTDASELIKGKVSDASIDSRGYSRVDELTEFRNPFPLFSNFLLSLSYCNSLSIPSMKIQKKRKTWGESFENTSKWWNRQFKIYASDNKFIMLEKYLRFSNILTFRKK